MRASVGAYWCMWQMAATFERVKNKHDIQRDKSGVDSLPTCRCYLKSWENLLEVWTAPLGLLWNKRVKTSQMTKAHSVSDVGQRETDRPEVCPLVFNGPVRPSFDLMLLQVFPMLKGKRDSGWYRKTTITGSSQVCNGVVRPSLY